jgi:maltooligosyltrehalose trehalohydrolase
MIMNPGPRVHDSGVDFAVWAPLATEITLVLQPANGDESRHAMRADERDVYSAKVESAEAGDRYAFEVNGNGPFPDPRSAFQPDGVHGFSEIVDHGSFTWTDDDWTGVRADDLVIYELHVGTMTPDGTFRALAKELPELARLGITAVEIMPVAECPGRWNWGYDGVSLYAPSHNYGRPDDFRAFVNAAHDHGIGVILDVVYNHLGPEGNYLGVYSDQYMSKSHTNSWGAGLNWDGPGSEFVRGFAIDNAVQWIRDYHIDGLRLDATHAIVDDSPMHLVQELTEAARQAAGSRSIYVVAEDERRDITRVRPVERGGEGLDAVWADDFHHEVRVLLTSARENYYEQYSGTTKAIATAINDGFGDEGHARGEAPDANDPASSFVFCIQNHDQVGNRPFGDRLHHEINADRYKVASTLLLLSPETPLLFMGQEFAASSPFLYFTDHPEELGKLVTEGRRKEFAGFRLFSDADLRESIPDPQAEATFYSSKLDPDDRDRHADIYRLYRDLIALRREDPVFRVNDRATCSATWVTAEIVALRRWQGEEHRLVLANFGNAAEVELDQFDGFGWQRVFSTSVADDSPVSFVPARTAVVLQGAT